MSQQTRDTSAYSDAHDFILDGGQHGVTGHNTSHHYHGHVQFGSQSHQAISSPAGVQPAINSDTTSTAENNMTTNVRPWSFSPTSLIHRFLSSRPLDTTVVDLVGAELTSQQCCSSSPKDAGIYLRHMLQHAHGYPLYRPEPKRNLPMAYRRNGIRIGDVGTVSSDGAFNFLFNVDESVASEVNPAALPDDFETLSRIEVMSDDYFQPRNHLLSDHVEQTKDQPIAYRFSSSEGAVLQLPQGATIFEAQNKNDLYDLAARHAYNWYQYLITTRSRDIPNGSLYLITECIKCRNWGIGSLYARPTGDKDHLQFIYEDQPVRRIYEYRILGPVIGKIGPTSEDVVAMGDEEPTQCIFIRGYRITLATNEWKKLMTRQKSSQGVSYGSMPQASTGNPASQNNSSLGGVSTSNSTANNLSMTGRSDEVPSADSSSHSNTSNSEREQVIVEELWRGAPPLHPSDFVNALLLRHEPKAKVAITHDSQWLELLPTDFAVDPSNLKIKDILQKVAEVYLAKVDLHGCVSLLKKPKLEPIGTSDVIISGAPEDNSGSTDGFTFRSEAISDSEALGGDIAQTPTDLSQTLSKMANGGRHNRLWLHNFVNRHLLGDLLWDEQDQTIENNRHLWTVTVQLGGTTYGQGQGRTRGEAKDNAAREALGILMERFGA